MILKICNRYRRVYMERKPIVVIPGWIRKEALEALCATCEVKQWTESEPISQEILEEWVTDADAIWATGIQLTKELIAKAPRLKVVANASVGYDHVDIEALSERGIPYGNTPHVLTECVAELSMGLIVAAARRIVENAIFVREGGWERRFQPHKGVELRGQTLGIIGFGNIGVSISRRARAFGMRIIYHNRKKREDDALYMAKYVSLEELYKESDVVISVLPLTEETEKLIGKEAFAMMKKEAIFVNVGRGKVVDTMALVAALREGEISYAALDVVDPEPLPKNHPLLAEKNCLILPHIASYTDRTRSEMAMLTVENILSGLRGKALPAVVNAEVNYPKEG